VKFPARVFRSMHQPNPPRMLASVLALIAVISLRGVALANPFDQQVRAVQVGDRLPGTAFVDQDGERFSFDNLDGRAAVVAFVFTHCKDECPLITERFAELDRILDPARYELVEVSIDPVHDRPAVIARYARAHGLHGRWRIVTGEPAAVEAFVRASGVSVIADAGGDIIHNAKLLIVDPDGRLADTVETIGWSATDVAAQAEHDAGASSSWYGRLDFALTGAIAALCGGSYQTASGIVDLIAAFFVILAGFFTLAWLRRRIFAQGG
jgi:cytochrome oxidase Cu insertion factor (SCO1/SenC/PrrC family)